MVGRSILTKIQKLIKELNTNDIRYCHWKSNYTLGKALSGQTDIDLLIHRKDADLFRTILSQLCFRPAVGKNGEFFPSVEHYFAFDEESGLLVHVHAYYRVITGESLSKNYHFPIEEMLLNNTRELDLVRVPTKSAEVVVFTLRMMLKHASLVELLLLSRNWEHVKQEISWLMESDSNDETLSLVRGWLPSLEVDLFSDCIAALKSPAPLLRRIILGHRLGSRLRIYARHSAIRAWLSGVRKFTVMLFRRLSGSQSGLTPLSGGAVIAFVGPEATGKSTLIDEMERWLGEHFVVERVHAGKPTSTILSVVPNLLVPILRSLFPNYRSSNIEAAYALKERSEESQTVYPLFYAIRSVLLAYDRRVLLTRAFGRAANGAIVLCDRYPSLTSGAPDSPQLSQILNTRNQYPIHRWLARIENQMYQEIPPPDLIISLTVPVEVALLRNKVRGKQEPEDYVQLRHAQSSKMEFEKTSIHTINTNQPLNKTILEVKKAVWDAL